MSVRPVRLEPVRLDGGRAALAPLEMAHVAGLFEAGRSPKIWDYMPMRVSAPADMERLAREALRARAEGHELPFVILDLRGGPERPAPGRVVGSTRLLDFTPAHRGAEIGWTWLAPEVWRTPINTECKYLLLRHCFETLGLIRIQLKTDARNLRAQRAIERLGAVREGVLRRHRILPDGYVRDSVYYSVVAEEWPAVRARLERLLHPDRA